MPSETSFRQKVAGDDKGLPFGHQVFGTQNGGHRLAFVSLSNNIVVSENTSWGACYMLVMIISFPSFLLASISLKVFLKYYLMKKDS
jgi:hypothetical protein